MIQFLAEGRVSDALKADNLDPGYSTLKLPGIGPNIIVENYLAPIPNARYEDIKQNNEGYNATDKIKMSESKKKEHYGTSEKKKKDDAKKAADKAKKAKNRGDANNLSKTR